MTTLSELVHSIGAQQPVLRALGTRGLDGALLRQQVNDIGVCLASAGIKAGDVVAVVLPNGVDMAVTFLGVATHTVCAPLNPAFRAAEFAYYLQDLSVRALIIAANSASPAREQAQLLGLVIFELEGDRAEPGRFTLTRDQQGNERGKSEPARTGAAEDVALVLHTSGTTARPKQVPLTHRQLLSSARAVATALALTPDDVSLNVMPLFHIHGLVGVLLASLHARASVICTSGFTPASFTRALIDDHVTWYSAVPTIHQSVVDAFASQGRPQRHSLRLIRSSSAPLPPSVMNRLEQCFGVPVIEAYGMTEAAHQMTSNPLPPALRKVGSVGLPAGPEIAIMDEGGKHLGAAELGEVVIRGPNVMSGYLNNAEANAGSYFDGGWFRTGDQGRLDDQGYLFLTGRLKEIINRAGEKISPREVDETLLEHPDVHQAVTFAVPHPTIGEDIATAVVMAPHARLDEPVLRHWLFARLAASKVPSRIVFVPAIPKGATGKVQRIGLYQQLQAHLQVEHKQPVTPTQQMLARICRDVLQIPAIGITDNFFALGGDSLRGARVIARLLEETGASLEVRELFQYPTIEHLALRVEAAIAAHEHALFEFVRQLPEEEVRRLLQDAGPVTGQQGNT